MVSDGEVESVRQFVHRYCAVEDAEDEERNEGYFAFGQGKSQRAATKAVRAPVAWGESEATLSAVMRRVRELASNGLGHVFIRAIRKGESNPDEVCKVTGELADDDDDDSHPISGGGVDAAFNAIVRTNQQLLRENLGWRNAAFARLENDLETRERMTMLAMHSAMMADGAVDQRVTEALKVLQPTIDRLAPRAMELFAQWAQGKAALPGVAGDLPTDPGERITAHIGRILQEAQALGALITANPTAATDERTRPLYDLIRQLEGPLGLKVRYPKAAPPEET